MAYPLPDKANSDDLSSMVPIRKVNLRDIVYTQRSMCLVTREQYYACSQHEAKMFDWDGYFLRFGSSSDIPASGYVPLKRRRPSARMDLPKVIVDRLTSMVFGNDRFPNIRIEGDPEAEDYANELAKQAKLHTRMIEARTRGGSQGTVVLSWGFIDGKPIVEVHDAAHCEVVEWENYEKREPGKIIKAYTYQRKIWDKNGKPKYKTYYYARYWDEFYDICWRDIPEEIAVTSSWWKRPTKLIRHDAGFTPVYWVQNIPDSGDVDGYGDYNDESHTNFDQIDMLLSATTKGAIANVDPTLVVKDHPENNDGIVRKGSENAIFSEKGAEYLELSGTAIEASRALLKDLRQYELDKAGVVLLDPDTAGGTALSASAMKQRYEVMLARCDVLRDQYGDVIVEILSDMLKVARDLRVVRDGVDGIQYWSQLDLPKKIDFVEKNSVSDDDEAEKEVVHIDRTPGESSNITLQWPPYFAPNWKDIKEAIDATKSATNGKQLLSQRTAVSSIGNFFGVDNIDQELGEIDADVERGVARANAMMDIDSEISKSHNENKEESDEKYSESDEE